MANEYVVLSGDTLEKVSANTGIPLAEIKEANPTAGVDGASLVPGSRLYLPSAPSPELVPPELVPLDPTDEVATEEVPAVNPVPVVPSPSAVPTAPPDPVSLETLESLYNKGSMLADDLHTFLSALAVVISAAKANGAL